VNTNRILSGLFTRSYIIVIRLVISYSLPASPSFLGVVGRIPKNQSSKLWACVRDMIRCTGTAPIGLALGVPTLRTHGLLSTFDRGSAGSAPSVIFFRIAQVWILVSFLYVPNKSSTKWGLLIVASSKVDQRRWDSQRVLQVAHHLPCVVLPVPIRQASTPSGIQVTSEDPRRLFPV
jgi:hypothetical protein